MKKKIIPALIAIVLIIIVIAAAGGATLIEHYSYSKERRDLNEYYKLKEPGQVAIVLQNKVIDTKARLIEGTYYLDFDSVAAILNDRFYVDDHEGFLIYTTANQIIQNPIGTGTYYISGEDVTVDYPITVMQGDTLYIALDFVKKYTNFSYEAFTDPDRIVMRTEWGQKKTATVKKNNWVRYQGGVKSDILRDIKQGEEVTIMEELEDWDKVITDDGIIGYIEKKRISTPTEVTEVPVTDYTEAEYTRIKKDYTINMAWHSIYTEAGNDTFDEMVNGTGTMSIISPTWISLSDNDGNFRSFANAAYVEKAHSRNMEVWMMVDNFNIEGISTYETMSYTSKRERLISGLINEATTYGIDGINLDFEGVPAEAVPHYVEFIRELSVACRRLGIVLSVDNYPPQGGSNYNLAEQGVCVDYVIIMGYDEHWGNGGIAGSVASIGFVQQGIQLVLNEGVPADKIINAVPFYTRVWKTNGSTVTSDALGMDAAANFIKEYNIETTWDADACQNYGEKEMNGTLYQVWLEDAQSIETKLNVMKTFGVAGVAEWQLGQENKAIWDIFDVYVRSAK
ncbi:MAG: chitinase [Lachnospiraceae bacterium]|nr:chitinase [Candidatus Colinaster scatohippi]